MGSTRSCAQPEVGQTSDLLARVLDRDEAAWSDFCRRYENLIAACVMRVLRRYGVTLSVADSADMVAEVWLALLRHDCRKLRAYDARRGYQLSSWLALIATNTTIDQLRARRIEPSYLEDMSSAERLIVDHQQPDTRLEQREVAGLARQALAHLTDEERRLVLSCYRDERPAAELAAELGVQVNTIYSRKFKVRQKLVRILATLHPDEVFVAP